MATLQRGRFNKTLHCRCWRGEWVIGQQPKPFIKSNNNKQKTRCPKRKLPHKKGKKKTNLNLLPEECKTVTPLHSPHAPTYPPTPEIHFFSSSPQHQMLYGYNSLMLILTTPSCDGTDRNNMCATRKILTRLTSTDKKYNKQDWTNKTFIK